MTMRVRVNLYSSLRNGRFAEADVELPMGATVADLLEKLEIPQQDAGIVMINAQSGTYQQKLKEGDKLTLIPPIGGG